MKIALVHDMLVQEGGQERVLRSLQELFPEAPTFVLMYNRANKQKYYPAKEIESSFLQKMPLVEKKYQWYLPLMRRAIESFDLSDFDLIFSSSSSFAKGVIKHSSARHICYCHTPTRYLWHDINGYVGDLPYPQIMKNFIKQYLKHIKEWDLKVAGEVDHFLANSETVKNRIKKYYNQESEVVYPPVDTGKFFISPELGDYYLMGGRLVPYKRYDLAVKTFNKLNIPLKIFGDGPERVRLEKIAGKNIEFLGNVSEEEKAELYSRCLAFINPQEEDFGITSIEAMASGRPVIAYASGGALEVVRAGETGVFIEDQDWPDLANEIIFFDPYSFNPKAIKAHAEKFSRENFKQKISDIITRYKNEYF